MPSEGLLIDEHTSTGHDVVIPAPAISITSRALDEEAGFLRSRFRLGLDDATALHSETTEFAWETQTTERAKEDIQELLELLSGRGFSWRDIARMVGVSVPALRKWRLGGTPSGENRRKVAEIVAGCDLLEDQHLISDVASWMEIPLRPTSLTPIDLYAAGLRQPIFEYAGGHASLEELLGRLDPEWRDKYISDYEVVESNDGNLSIRPIER